ncbi:MAG: hypothetical protein AABZ28_01765 [Nitrospinota bacterium]
MKKNIQIIIFGSLIYWGISFLFHKLFRQMDTPWGILFTAMVGPFILGIIISVVIKSKSWLYGGISYLLYFVWVFILGWMIELRFTGFVEHFFAIAKAFFYLGSVATLFAAFGGFIGEYIRKRSSS